MALVILKIIMFAVLLAGPIVIGRELAQAARGRVPSRRRAPQAAPGGPLGTAPAEEDAA